MITEFNYQRYLSAKKTVDDRALNRAVWERMILALTGKDLRHPLEVLEIGAGIGTMAERFLGAAPGGEIFYRAIDVSAENIREARERLTVWGEGNGYTVEPSGADLLLRRSGIEAQVRLECLDLFELLDWEGAPARYDLLLANAFLDLIDLPAYLPAIAGLLREGGHYLFTINFDGETIFQPPFDDELEAAILACYHRTMDERTREGAPSGDSRTGRALFRHLPAAGLEILAAGSSDWVVFPGKDRYPADEAYFLHFIIHTVATALKDHPEIDPDQLRRWAGARHEQVEQRKLIYIAHQLDFFGKKCDFIRPKL
ncbi:MAG: class I SAM-dependent methyltransferase [Calditrichaeota bacterium]|nr:class I SAM-dependent methyltransferase [Calditrichota bacterium]